MIEDREEWLADTLVTLADTLIARFDVVEFLLMLAERIQELIEHSEVGLILVDTEGRLRVMASSTERTRMIELFEIQTSEGPCWDCYRGGKPVLNADLAQTGARWPVFTPLAVAAGFQMVHAMPMRLCDQVIGAANIFSQTPVTISGPDIHLVQALADAATIGLLQARAAQRAADLAEQLQHALNSRVAIEQAKGAVAERANVDMDTAFGWLRGFARTNNLRLADVALGVVTRTVSVETLMAASAELTRNSSYQPPRR